MIIRQRRTVYSQIAKFARQPSFCFSYQLPSHYPCCINPTSKARYTSHSSKIKEAYENETWRFEREGRNLRFGRRRSFRLRLLCLGLGLSSLLGLLGCIGSWGSLGLATIR